MKTANKSADTYSNNTSEDRVTGVGLSWYRSTVRGVGGVGGRFRPLSMPVTSPEVRGPSQQHACTARNKRWGTTLAGFRHVLRVMLHRFTPDFLLLGYSTFADVFFSVRAESWLDMLSSAF
jgi:hypothetical protein